jgi:hypothetical protein
MSERWTRVFLDTRRMLARKQRSQTSVVLVVVVVEVGGEAGGPRGSTESRGPKYGGCFLRQRGLRRTR